MEIKKIEKIEKIRKNALTKGSIRDAAAFLDLCIHKAFPDFSFRGLEITNLRPTEKIIEGKSWNHIFKIERLYNEDKSRVWEVTCHRVSHGETEDKKAIIDYYTLEPIN